MHVDLQCADPDIDARFFAGEITVQAQVQRICRHVPELEFSEMIVVIERFESAVCLSLRFDDLSVPNV